MHKEKRKKSLEKETFNKEEDCRSPTSKPPKPEQPPKVMPAPPPKENAWGKLISELRHRATTVVLAQPTEEGPAGKVKRN
eukprot:bmy_18942T0